jgi:hypothetical protein
VTVGKKVYQVVAATLVVAAVFAACRARSDPAPTPVDIETPLVQPTPSAMPAPQDFRLLRNQVGYLPGYPFSFVLSSSESLAGRTLTIRNAHKEAVHASITLDAGSLATTGRGTLRLATLRVQPLPIGKYGVRIGQRETAFEVSELTYARVFPAIVQFLRTQRCGNTTVALSQHGACHLWQSVADADATTQSGDGLAVDETFKDKVTGHEPKANAEGGWHDAGDYVKFVGTTSFTVVLGLLAARDSKELDEDAGGHVRQALLDELRWGLAWLERMVGGKDKFHQVGSTADHHVRDRAPEDDTLRPVPEYPHRPVVRFGVGKGRNLLARSSAAFALAAQVYQADAPFAELAKRRAIDLFSAASSERVRLPQQSVPADWYTDPRSDDDLALAAALVSQVDPAAVTRDAALQLVRMLPLNEGEPLSYANLEALAVRETERLFAAGSAARRELSKKLHALAEPFVSIVREPRGEAAAFRPAVARFGNGSTQQLLGAASVCGLVVRDEGDELTETGRACLASMSDQVDFVFGKNPFAASFVIGFGETFPHAIHHGLHVVRRVDLTGAPVGGPTTLSILKENKELYEVAKKARAPLAGWSSNAVFYEDRVENYVTNETAIDFAATLFFALAMMVK